MQKLYPPLYQLWERLTKPHPSVTDRYERTSARLLAFIAGVSLIGTIIAICLTVFATYFSGATTLLFYGAPFAALIYVMSRTRFYRVAATLSIITSFILMYAVIQFSRYPAMYAIGMIVPLIFASFFWSWKPMLSALLVSALAVISIIGFDSAFYVHLWNTLFFTILPASCMVYITHLRQQNTQQLGAQEAHYRNLFELSPVSLWEEDFSEVRRYLETLLPKAQPNLNTYLRAHPEEVAQCVALIKVTSVNQATVKLYEAASKEELFSNLKQIFVHDNLNIFVDELVAISEGQREYSNIEHEANMTLKGNRLDISLRWAVVPGYEHDMSRVILAIEDITDRKRLERQRLQLELERERGDVLHRFIGDASHDLNTSITMLHTSLYLLGKQSIQEQKPRIETMEGQVLRLEKMIQDMLFISRFDHLPDEEFSLQRTDLSGWTASLTEHYQALASKRRQVLHMNINPAFAMLDTHYMGRALANLLDNAMKYSPEGGVIEINVCTVGTDAMIEVRDSGSGIAAENLPHIFESLYRAEDYRSTTSGMELGLTIALKIVEKHGGTLRAESEAGRGAIFRILLPAV
jgi:signal transduction histidine kinase